MRVVDDIDSGFDRGLGMDADAGGIAAHRVQRADLDDLVLRQSMACQDNRNRGSTKRPEDMLESHVKGLRNVSHTTPNAEKRSRDVSPPSLPVSADLHRMPASRGQVSDRAHAHANQSAHGAALLIAFWIGRLALTPT